MSNNAVDAIQFIAVVLLIILVAGKPDLLDALISYVHIAGGQP